MSAGGLVSLRPPLSLTLQRQTRASSVAPTVMPDLFDAPAGWLDSAPAVGLGAAVDYLTAVGFDAIEQHEHDLTEYALAALQDIPAIKLFGPPPDRRAGIVSFAFDDVHPHDVAQVLDWEGVAVRAGHHCCQPLMARLGVAATTRASFYLYTIPDEIDRLVHGLHRVRKVFG